MKLWPLLILISFSVFGKNIVSQKDCSNTDIRDTNPKIKNNKVMREHFSTPRNQDSIGWCYAFVAADLLSAELDTPISSIHASMIYNQFSEKGLLDYVKDLIEDKPGPVKKFNTSGNFKMVTESGHLDRAIRALRDRKKVCPERLLPFDQHLGKSTMSLIKKIEAIKLNVINKKLQEKMVCQELSQVLPLYGISTLEYDDIAHSLMTDNIHATLDLLAKKNCKDNLVKIPMRYVKYLAPDNAAFFSSINQTLNHGKPLSMNYNVNSVATFSGNHVSLITARRWNNGRCEYKVRNTWGASCASYQSGIDCNRQEGAFWLSDEKLKSTATQVHYLFE